MVHIADAYGNKVDAGNCVDKCERLAANISATICEVGRGREGEGGRDKKGATDRVCVRKRHRCVGAAVSDNERGASERVSTFLGPSLCGQLP